MKTRNGEANTRERVPGGSEYAEKQKKDFAFLRRRFIAFSRHHN
jgi:hypothetical protein